MTAQAPPWLGDVLVALSALLFGALLAWAPRAVRLVGALLGGLDRRERALVAAAVLAGLALRAAVPHRLVMVYFGYDLVQAALSLDTVSRYGGAAQVLWNALFAVAPVDHTSVLWLHAALGTLTIALAAALARGLSAARGVAAFAAWAVALTPLFVRDSVSESLLVSATTWALCAAVAAVAWARGADRELAAVAVGLGLVALTRSDALPGALALAALGAWAGAGSARALASRLRARPALTWSVAAALALVCLPVLVHAHAAGEADRAAGNLPWLAERSLLDHLPEWLLRRNVLLTPSRFPAALTALAALGCLSHDRTTRLASRALAATALAWIALYFIDFNEASMERLHAPGALLVTLAAALAVGSVAARSRLAAALAVGAWALSCVPTVPRLFERTNEDLEDTFLRTVRATLPHEPTTLVRVGWNDAGNGVHRHYPEYLFAARGDRFVDVADWQRAPSFERPVYFLLGMRCYAELRPDGAAPPSGAPLHPACAAMRASWRFETRLEQRVPNLGTEYFRWYPADSELTLGLYRVLPP